MDARNRLGALVDASLDQVVGAVVGRGVHRIVRDGASAA